MNILLVEDTKIKRIAIEHSMHHIRPEAKFKTIDNLEEAKSFLDRNYKLADLLILDWCFPLKYNESPVTGAGKEMLDYILDNDYNVKTIICSGNVMNEEELAPYYFLLGHVLFGHGNPGHEIYNIYLDYLDTFAKKYRNASLKEYGPKVKKLVNHDVK